MNMLVYCPELSPRLQYILKLLLGDILGISYKTSNLLVEFIHHDGPKINYSFEPIKDLPFIQASGLLFEPKIVDQKEAMGKLFFWKDLPVFYKAEEPSLIPFDIFSAAFYLVTRYEEYLPHTKDEHERFPASESLAFKENFLELPLINLWTLGLGEVIKEIFGDSLSLQKTKYQFIPTIDVDNAWAFKNKGIRILAKFIKKATMEDRNYRYQVLRGKQADPFDQFDLMQQIFNSKKLKPVYFFLLGKLSHHDRNTNPKNKALRKLIKKVGANFTVGIHPSYRSNQSSGIVESEIKTLGSIIDDQVTKSRQHFIKFQLPYTYRTLNSLGIQEEYSMGYPDQIGFRASIASQFPFFDLESNTATDLCVIPFQIMDVSLQQYMQLNPDEAIEKIHSMAEQVKAVNGVFSVLWHNESLSEWKHWKGWSRVFREMIEIATP